jgi:hypothetical protein
MSDAIVEIVCHCCNHGVPRLSDEGREFILVDPTFDPTFDPFWPICPDCFRSRYGDEEADAERQAIRKIQQAERVLGWRYR